MTYYLLPKTNHPFSIKMTIQNEEMVIYTSHSLFFLYQKITKQFIHLFTPLNCSLTLPFGRDAPELGALNMQRCKPLPLKNLQNEYQIDFFNNFKNKVFSEPLDQDTFNYFKMEFISKIFHPYEYLFQKIPNSKFPVSKLHQTERNLGRFASPDSDLSENENETNSFSFTDSVNYQKENFYHFYEITKTVDLFNNFHKKNITILTISPNADSIQECIEFVRDDSKDEFVNYSSFQSYNSFFKEKEKEKEQERTFDFIFYELDKEKYQNENEYIIGLIQIVIILLKIQKQGGYCIIKIDNMFLKPIVDMIYLLTSLYEKTYVMKPMVSNIVTFEKYLICKNFTDDSSSSFQREKLVYYLEKFQEYREKKMVYISSILDSLLPCYFISKINDINIIIGQQQLDAIQQMIVFFTPLRISNAQSASPCSVSLPLGRDAHEVGVLNVQRCKNKNKEKMNQMIKMHIYKSMKWCEKFKIPHHTGL